MNDQKSRQNVINNLRDRVRNLLGQSVTLDRTVKAEITPFWKSVPIEDLVEQQNVSPADDLDEIAALWPADDDPEELLKYLMAERTEHRKLSKDVETDR